MNVSRRRIPRPGERQNKHTNETIVRPNTTRTEPPNRIKYNTEIEHFGYGRSRPAKAPEPDEIVSGVGSNLNNSSGAGGNQIFSSPPAGARYVLLAVFSHLSSRRDGGGWAHARRVSPSMVRVPVSQHAFYRHLHVATVDGTAVLGLVRLG